MSLVPCFSIFFSFFCFFVLLCLKQKIYIPILMAGQWWNISTQQIYSMFWCFHIQMSPFIQENKKTKIFWNTASYTVSYTARERVKAAKKKKDVDVYNIVVPKLIKMKTNSKYLIGYLDKVIRQLVWILPKMSEYVKTLKVKDIKMEIKIRTINWCLSLWMVISY